MDNHIITKKQTIAIMLAFLLGSSMVLGTGREAGKDAWIAILAACIMVLPLVLILSRILSLFPGMGLYEIIFTVYGRIIGTVFTLIYVWYTFHIGALVLRNFSEFVKIVGLHETPQFVTAAVFMLLCIWAVKAGIEAIARWTAIVLPIMLLVIFTITMLLIPEYNINNIRPLLYDGVLPVIDASFSVLAFPFAEIVVCSIIFCYVKRENKPYKIFIWSILISAAVLSISTFRSLLVLGAGNIRLLFFASYASARLVKLGDFLERIEVTVAIVFLLGGFVKTSICLLSASKGIADSFGIQDHRKLAAPVGLLIMMYSLVLFESTIEMFDWASQLYKYYAVPFEIILPVIIWIGAEIKAARQRKAGSQQC